MENLYVVIQHRDGQTMTSAAGEADAYAQIARHRASCTVPMCLTGIARYGAVEVDDAAGSWFLTTPPVMTCSGGH